MKFSTSFAPVVRVLSGTAIASLGAVAALTTAPVAQAAAVTDFSTATFESLGNLDFSDPAAPIFSTASSTASPAADALVTPVLQDFLGLGNTALDGTLFGGAVPLAAFEGAALRFAVNAGDRFSFDFATSIDGSGLFGPTDLAFVVIDGAVQPLSGSGSFSQTFANAGLFGVGVVDRDDVLGDSTLTLSNADFTPVPTPALLPGLMGLALGVVCKRRSALTSD